MRQFFEDLRSLDMNDVGRWPFLFRALTIGIIFVAVTAGAVYYFVIKQKMPLLEAAQAQEQQLRGAFELKQRKAANFDAYKAQLAEIEESFGAMLRQLPGKTEVPSLLVDISQTGLAAGLEEELFRPQGELVREFYAELPITIRLSGTYHELARFVSDVAALPRIVTIHDVSLKKQKDGAGGDLVMDLTAKTYRYLEEGEEQS
ncbi:MAG: type 4a pilus biogenesis protein PilO [Gammaproteobacteria bacterium]|jgi:type IV pilus assembly protein PilO|nr:MAG: pilus assembly protein PilO [Gammaproteobacteria bacterium SG8_31]